MNFQTKPEQKKYQRRPKATSASSGRVFGQTSSHILRSNKLTIKTKTERKNGADSEVKLGQRLSWVHSRLTVHQ